MRSLVLMLLATAAFAAAPDLNKTIPELKLTDGRVLKNVTLVSYAASAVMAKWDGGRGTIRYDDFPDEYQSALAKERPKASTYIAPPPAPKAPQIANAPTATPSPPQTRTISGQLFITTNGAGAYKFSGTAIRVFSAERFDELLRTESMHLPGRYRLLDHYEAVGEEIDAWIKTLAEQPMVASALTDAEGKFTLTVPATGKYFVFAGSFRMVGLIKEWNCWVHPLPESGELLLSNGNEWRQPK